MKPGSGMPAVFGASEQDKTDSEAVVHYLMSLGSVPEWRAAATEMDGINQGRKLYHSLGCVACHGALDDPAVVFGEQNVGKPGGTVAMPAAPFGTMAGKWRPAGLAEFLKDPVRTHPGGRMPSMSLKDSEADLIATYLANAWNPKDFKPAEFKSDPAKVEAGKAVFAARGCASCHHTGHELPDVASTLAARPLSELKTGAGCLDVKDTGTPRYTLSDADRADIEAGMVEAKRITGKDVAAPIDVGQRLISALGCVHCHVKDEIGGPADNIRSCFRTIDDVELGDEGRFPPRLTGVGMKLQTPWLKEVLTEAGRARPYMATRMPQYGRVVGELAGELALMDGVMPDTDLRGPLVNDTLVLAGRKLVGDKALSCITCHSYAGKVAGTAGPDITHFASRLRYEWWRPYLMAPARFKPGTRMTAFFADGKGKIADVFAGDPDRQSEAMWAYFTTSGGAGGPQPEGLPMQGGLPVIVGDRPAVFRTFMKDAGSRGIAVASNAK
jgi:cytochrome c2